MTHLTWIAVLAIIIGGLVRALKSDGAKGILAKFNLPPVPTRALPWVALVFGGLAAGLDAYLEGGGASVQEAAMTAVLAAATAVFGHELGSGVPGVKRLLGVGFLVFGFSSLSACTPGARAALIDAFAEMAACGLANMNLPDEQMLAMCGARTLEDRARLLQIVGRGRTVAAHEASVAAERAHAEAVQAAAAGKVGACNASPDAGKP